jgi:glutathione S-transferase
MENLAMMKLYQFEGCPYCKMVRQRMSDLLLTYECINVPTDRSRRQAVIAVSGQPSVPVLVDGDTVLDDENDIIAYLDRTYAKQ